MQMRSTRKWLLAVGLSLLALYLVLIPANSALYDVLLFPLPDPRIPNVDAQIARLAKHGITRKEVVLKSSNGSRLEGWFLENPETRRVFLYSHSKGNNIYGKIHVAESLLSCGGSVFMYDYQGFGKSEGRASPQNACDDGVAAYDYLIDKEGRSDKDIIGFGESLGSGVTGQLLKKRRLAGVIFQSGFASLKSAAVDKCFWLRLYPDWCFPPQIMDNVEVFSKPHPPLLMSHGTKDGVVRYENAMALYDSAVPPKTLLTMPGGGHGSVGTYGEFYIAVLKFLKQYNL
jgi:pimeloyl-ACP methyl ester carboxylesterase